MKKSEMLLSLVGLLFAFSAAGAEMQFDSAVAVGNQAIYLDAEVNEFDRTSSDTSYVVCVFHDDLGVTPADVARAHPEFVEYPEVIDWLIESLLDEHLPTLEDLLDEILDAISDEFFPGLPPGGFDDDFWDDLEAQLEEEGYVPMTPEDDSWGLPW